MRRDGFKFSGFTLIELILVMVIIAIIVAIVMPSLGAFSAGRANSNTATQLVTLANYARSQAAAESRTYRLNFDAKSGTYWLTAQDGGAFVSPGTEFNQRFTIPPGVLWDITPGSKPNMQLNIPADEHQETVQMEDSLSQPQQQAAMLQNIHDKGVYISFDATGRSDPFSIRLTDKRNGGVIEIACTSATELFHILTPEEMTR